MNQQIKQKWIDALRSGEYKQGTEHLKKDGCFCCLGVLTDLYVKEKGLNWDGEYFENESDLLHGKVMNWAGIEKRDPTLSFSKGFLSFPKSCEITHLNDSKKLTFEQLADLIEQQL